MTSNSIASNSTPTLSGALQSASGAPVQPFALALAPGPAPVLAPSAPPPVAAPAPSGGTGAPMAPIGTGGQGNAGVYTDSAGRTFENIRNGPFSLPTVLNLLQEAFQRTLGGPLPLAAQHSMLDIVRAYGQRVSQTGHWTPEQKRQFDQAVGIAIEGRVSGRLSWEGVLDEVGAALANVEARAAPGPAPFQPAPVQPAMSDPMQILTPAPATPPPPVSLPAAQAPPQGSWDVIRGDVRAMTAGRPWLQDILPDIVVQTLWGEMQSGRVDQTVEGARRWLSNLQGSPATVDGLVDAAQNRWRAQVGSMLDQTVSQTPNWLRAPLRAEIAGRLDGEISAGRVSGDLQSVRRWLTNLASSPDTVRHLSRLAAAPVESALGRQLDILVSELPATQRQPVRSSIVTRLGDEVAAGRIENAPAALSAWLVNLPSSPSLLSSIFSEAGFPRSGGPRAEDVPIGPQEVPAPIPQTVPAPVPQTVPGSIPQPAITEPVPISPTPVPLQPVIPPGVGEPQSVPTVIRPANGAGAEADPSGAPAQVPSPAAPEAEASGAGGAGGGAANPPVAGNGEASPPEGGASVNAGSAGWDMAEYASLQARLSDVIREVRQAADDARPVATLRDEQNVARLEYDLGGVTGGLNGASGGRIIPNFVPPVTAGEAVIAPLYDNRAADTEYKLLNWLAKNLIDHMDGAQTSGRIVLYSQFSICTSCANVIQEFKRMFPLIDVVVIAGTRPRPESLSDPLPSPASDDFPAQAARIFSEADLAEISRRIDPGLLAMLDDPRGSVGGFTPDASATMRRVLGEHMADLRTPDDVARFITQMFVNPISGLKNAHALPLVAKPGDHLMVAEFGGGKSVNEALSHQHGDDLIAAGMAEIARVVTGAGGQVLHPNGATAIIVVPPERVDDTKRRLEEAFRDLAIGTADLGGTAQVFKPGIAVLDTGPIVDASVGGLEGQFARGRGGIDAVKAERVDRGLYPARGADVFQPYVPGVHLNVRPLEGSAQVPPTGSRQEQNAVLRERFDELSEQIAAMSPQDRERLATRAIQERFMHGAGVLNGAAPLTAPRGPDGRVSEGYVHAQGDLSRLSQINGFSWRAGDEAIGHLNAAIAAAAADYPSVTFQKYGGDEWEAIGPRADVEAAAAKIRDYLSGVSIQLPNPENPAETLTLRGLGVQIGVLEVPREASTGRAPSEALEHEMSRNKAERNYQLDIRDARGGFWAPTTDSRFFESQIESVFDGPLDDPMDLLDELLSDDLGSSIRFRDLAAGLGRNPVMVASAGGSFPIGMGGGRFDAASSPGLANFPAAGFGSRPLRLSDGPLATGEISPQAVLGVALTPVEEVYSTAQLQAAEDLWKAVDEGRLSFASFAEAAQAIEQRSADVGRAAAMRFDPGLAAEAVTRIVGRFSPELSRKAKLIHDGFVGVQNAVNFAADQAGAGNKAAVALSRIATNPLVFGSDGARWASAALGSYNVAQNAWNGLGGFQDGGRTALGVASGASLILGSGLLGPKAVGAAGFINDGVKVDQAVKLINAGNPIAGYGLAASVLASRFEGPVARIAENLFGAVSSAALLATNPLTAIPGLLLGGFGLFQSITQAFSSKWIEISDEHDVSGDGVNDVIKFELKNDDWSFRVRNGTTHLPIGEFRFSVAQRTRDAAPGAITDNSVATDWLNRTDGKDKVAGEYVLTLDPKFVLPHAGPSTGFGKHEKATVTINQQQYDALFGPGGPLAGRTSGNLMADLDPHQIDALRKHIPRRDVTFVQEKKNEGMHFTMDVDGDGVLDSITTFPKIKGGVDGDGSSIVRLKTKDGEVYAEFARNKDGSNSTQSRAASALAAAGGERVAFGADPATRSTGVVKVHYDVLARRMGPEEKLFGLSYIADKPELAATLMKDSGGVTSKTLDVLAAKAFWHMIYEAPKHPDAYKLTFDPVAYLAANPDIAGVFSSPVPGQPDKRSYDLLAATQHYITDGMRLGLKTTPDDVGAGDNGLWNTVDVFGEDMSGTAIASGQPVAAGTPADDALLGSDGDDLLLGKAGDDILWGGRGSDELHGGKGDDVLFGEKGHDILYGGQGRDFLFGGAGNDVGYGWRGEDVLLMGKGEDLGRGGKGNDFVHGQQGNDHVFGDRGDDEVHGGKGDDVVHGGKGDDRVFGGKGNDVLFGDRGDDEIDGGEGFDTAGFSGSLDDYAITREGDGFRIVDKRADGDGSDLVRNVEAFRFAGATLSIDQIEARIAAR